MTKTVGNAVRDKNNDRIVPAIGIVLYAALALGLPPALGLGLVAIVFGIAAAEYLGLAVSIIHHNKQTGSHPRTWWWFSGVIYFFVGEMTLAGVILRSRLLPVYFVALAFVSDTAAYEGGKRLGRHKRMPRVSPGKSWEGVGFGLAGAMVVAGVCYATSWSGSHGSLIFLSSAALAICGVGGDLLESWIKRRAGEKDSGTILRGHGGVFDRIDALLMIVICGGGFYLLGLLG